MKPTVEQIESLLALKRHERPGEGYFEDFLVEFHRRRREEEAALTGVSGWWKKATRWISEVGSAKWAYGLGAAYAAIAAVFLLSPETTEIQPMPVAPVDFKVEPMATEVLEQLEELDLRPSTQGSTGEQVF